MRTPIGCYANTSQSNRAAGCDCPAGIGAVHKLNSRLRKRLGFRTPYEMFRELSGTDAEKLVGYVLITLIQEILFFNITQKYAF
jgi:hypothetical protein